MFTNLSHHRTCRSAYGGSYLGYHSRYEPIKVQYPAFHRLSLFIATFNIGLSAIRHYPLRVLPHSHALYFSIPHLMRFTALVLGASMLSIYTCVFSVLTTHLYQEENVSYRQGDSIQPIHVCILSVSASS